MKFGGIGVPELIIILVVCAHLRAEETCQLGNKGASRACEGMNGGKDKEAEDAFRSASKKPRRRTRRSPTPNSASRNTRGASALWLECARKGIFHLRRRKTIMADQNILTKEGKQKLEDELHYLETEKRAEVGERIRIAQFGDISENSGIRRCQNERGLMEALYRRNHQHPGQRHRRGGLQAFGQGDRGLHGHGRHGRQAARLHDRGRRRIRRPRGARFPMSPRWAPRSSAIRRRRSH